MYLLGIYPRLRAQNAVLRNTNTNITNTDINQDLIKNFPLLQLLPLLQFLFLLNPHVPIHNLATHSLDSVAARRVPNPAIRRLLLGF